MQTKLIEVRAARTQEDVLNHQCNVVNEFETIADAKRAAKRYLSDEYQRSSETSYPLQYSQVVVNGECLYDFFR